MKFWITIVMKNGVRKEYKGDTTFASASHLFLFDGCKCTLSIPMKDINGWYCEVIPYEQ